MVKEELVGDLTHHYSDKGYPLRQIETGVIYDETYDITPCPYTYEEAPEEAEDEVTSEELVNILLGEDGES